MAGVRLGVLGGTFDPVHRGHLVVAAAAHAELGLDRVLFMPAGQPWRKGERGVTSGEHRLAMLRLALEGEVAFEIVTLELEREGPSYTADTLEALLEGRPNEEVFLILGEDALVDLPNWVRPGRIRELATLVVARRVGIDPKDVEEAARRAPEVLDRVVWLKMPPVEVSATEIRERVQRGLSIGDLVPPAVEAYIREHALYRA